MEDLHEAMEFPVIVLTLKWADLLLETEVVNGNRKVYETEAENPD
jgi:hypothetical protein